MKGIPTTAADKQREEKWRTEDDLRTLCAAEEIKKDPARMKKCKEMAKMKMNEMKSVAN